MSYILNEEKKLGFGFLRLPSKDINNPSDVDMEHTCKMVDSFIKAGFKYFDTAYNYLNYKSENFIKEALTDRYERDEFILTTKLPCKELKDEDSAEDLFNEQLNKCGVDYFDVYLLHGLNKSSFELSQKRGYFDLLQKLKTEGKTKYTGFSFHDTAEVLDEILTAHPEIDVVQIQLNYLDWENPIIQSGKCYEVCRKHNKPMIIMEPVKGGTLANIPKEARDKMNALNPNHSPAAWAIRFAASQEGVIMVLSGMSNMDQIEDNISFMKDFKPLTKEETQMLKECAEIVRNSVAIACTGCSYCTNGCPKQIPIPRYLSLYNEHKRDGWQIDAPTRYNDMIKKFEKASECIECGQCEDKCPQQLKIIDWLKVVAKEFEESK